MVSAHRAGVHSPDPSKETKVLTLEHVQACAKNIHQLELWTYGAIEDDALKALSPLKSYLNLNGLTILPESSAVLLGRHRGILDLSGLRELSDTAIAKLADMKGGLWLNGLTRLSDKAAEALSKHEGDLYLRGLTELSLAAAEALSRHKDDDALRKSSEFAKTACDLLFGLKIFCVPDQIRKPDAK